MRGPIVILLIGLFAFAAAVGAKHFLQRSLPVLEEPGGQSPYRPAPVRRSAVPLEAPAGIDARWTAANNEAIQALDAEDYERAILLLEGAVAALPNERVLAANLAEALARRAVRDQASADADRARPLLDLERAIALDAKREDLVRLLERWRAAAEVEAEFVRYGSSHFELSFDGARMDLVHNAQVAIDVLEVAYGDFRELFSLDPVANGQGRIRVVLTTREEFERATGLGHWAGGAYDGTLRLPVEDLGGRRSGWRQVLRHELLHLFVDAAGGPSVPGWLNEGLAQWVEETRSQALARARQALRGRPLLSLDDLSAPLARLGPGEALEVAYRQSLLFVDHLMREAGEWVVLEMVKGCAQGHSPADTYRRLVSDDLEQALAQLAQTLR